MKMASEYTRTENGALALTAEGVARKQRDEQGERGGALVALNGTLVGPRTHGKNSDRRSMSFGGISRGDLKDSIRAAMTEAEQLGDFSSQLQTVDLFVMMMQTGAVRDGRGERALFVWFFMRMYDDFPETGIGMLELIPEYVSWRALNQIYETAERESDTSNSEKRSSMEKLMDSILQLYSKTLRKDEQILEKSQSSGNQKESVKLSLAAKWAPSIGSSYDKTAGMGKALAKILFPGGPGTDQTSKKYNDWCQRSSRKLLSKLRKALDVTEIKMTGKRWREIVPEHVASSCNRINRFAFQNKLLPRTQRYFEGKQRGGVVENIRFPDDPDRIACAKHFEEAIANSLAGKEGKKIKGSANQPHELIKIYMNATTPDPMIEAMWLDLRTRLSESGEFKPGIPLVDVSGSMSGIPMEVSIAMGILMSQLLPEPWRGRMLTFETNPRWHDISECQNLFETVKSVMNMPWGGSTDFAKAMDAILEVCREGGLTDDQLPKTMFVFSDMHFNSAYRAVRTRSGQNLSPFDIAGRDIRSEFKKLGFETAPHVVFWNLRAASPSFQAESTTPGVSMLSGYSQQMMKDFLEHGVLDIGPAPTPWETLSASLSKPVFLPIRQKCAEIGEKIMRGYTTPAEETIQE